MRPEAEELLHNLGVYKDIAELMLFGVEESSDRSEESASMLDRLEDTIDSFEVVEAFIRSAEATLSKPK